MIHAAMVGLGWWGKRLLQAAEALAHGEGDLDWAVMARVKARSAGLE